MTKIEWCDEVWNPITGCSPVSEGCQHCWAKRMAYRVKGRFGYPADKPFDVTVHESELDDPKPNHWKKPRRIFVCSMGDIFHEKVVKTKRRSLTRIYHIMRCCPQHTFLLLTKRPENIPDWDWPKNVWLGVSVENKKTADERIPKLWQVKVAHRYISLEPLLEEIYLPGPLLNHGFGYTYNQKPEKIDWVIIGCESINGRPGRFCKDEKKWWNACRDIVNQCKTANVPVFIKQGPVVGRVSHEPAEWPDGLRFREMPDNV